MTRRSILRLLGLFLFAPAKPLPLPEPIKPVPPLPVPGVDREEIIALVSAWYREAVCHPNFQRYVREADEDERYYSATPGTP